MARPLGMGNHQTMTDPQHFTLIDGELVVSVDSDHVATLEMRRPPNNFFDTKLIEAIAHALERVAEVGARCVVMCSQGKRFFTANIADDSARSSALAPTIFCRSAVGWCGALHLAVAAVARHSFTVRKGDKVGGPCDWLRFFVRISVLVCGA